jgi:hypothetical protein
MLASIHILTEKLNYFRDGDQGLAMEACCFLTGRGSDHGNSGLATEPGDLAVSGEDVGGDILGGTTHDRHVGGHAEHVDIVSAVGLA